MYGRFVTAAEVSAPSRAHAQDMVIGFIIGCEIAFWVVLAAGLLLRYPFKARRAGAVVLALVPVVDVVLLAACFADLHGGATAGRIHALAALYLGFSVAFGPSIIRWADARFAYRFAGGPKPVKVPSSRAKEWREFGKAALAWAITCALLGLGILWIGPGERTAALQSGIYQVSLVLAIWFVAGPLFASDKVKA